MPLNFPCFHDLETLKKKEKKSLEKKHEHVLDEA